MLCITTSRSTMTRMRTWFGRVDEGRRWGKGSEQIGQGQWALQMMTTSIVISLREPARGLMMSTIAQHKMVDSTDPSPPAQARTKHSIEWRDAQEMDQDSAMTSTARGSRSPAGLLRRNLSL